MAENEIKLSEYELESCEGNLRTLATQWAGMPTIDCTVELSRGKSAETVKDLPDAVKETVSSFSTLVDNSLRFFEAAGLTFMQSDEEAAKNIDTLST